MKNKFDFKKQANNLKNKFSNLKISKNVLLGGMVFLVMCVVTATAVYGNSDSNTRTPARIETISVGYGVNLKVNGKLYQPIDGNGQVIETFIYAGTTYVPIRAISELFGATVTWDNNTRTATIRIPAEKNLTHMGYEPEQKVRSVANIDVTRDVTIIVENEVLNPTTNKIEVITSTLEAEDVNGVSVPPIFLYKGTNFVPLRTISKLFGADIVWEASTYTVLLSKDDTSSTGDYPQVALDDPSYNKYQKEAAPMVNEIHALAAQIRSEYEYIKKQYGNYPPVIFYSVDMMDDLNLTTSEENRVTDIINTSDNVKEKTYKEIVGRTVIFDDFEWLYAYLTDMSGYQSENDVLTLKNGVQSFKDLLNKYTGPIKALIDSNSPYTFKTELDGISSKYGYTGGQYYNLD